MYECTCINYRRSQLWCYISCSLVSFKLCFLLTFIGLCVLFTCKLLWLVDYQYLSFQKKTIDILPSAHPAHLRHYPGSLSLSNVATRCVFRVKHQQNVLFHASRSRRLPFNLMTSKWRDSLGSRMRVNARAKCRLLFTSASCLERRFSTVAFHANVERNLSPWSFYFTFLDLKLQMSTFFALIVVGPRQPLHCLCSLKNESPWSKIIVALLEFCFRFVLILGQ